MVKATTIKRDQSESESLFWPGVQARNGRSLLLPQAMLMLYDQTHAVVDCGEYTSSMFPPTPMHPPVWHTWLRVASYRCILVSSGRCVTFATKAQYHNHNDEDTSSTSNGDKNVPIKTQDLSSTIPVNRNARRRQSEPRNRCDECPIDFTERRRR